MQKIKVKEVKGPLGKGEKKFFAVVDEKGAEFTTFDTKIQDVVPGSLLNIEPKIDGKYINIAKWEILEAAPNPTPQIPGNFGQILARSAALIASGGDLPLASKYVTWITQGKPEAQAKPPTTAEEDWDNLKSGGADRNPDEIKKPDALLKACKADFNMQPKDVYAELNVNTYQEFVALKKTPAELYRQIKAVRS